MPGVWQPDGLMHPAYLLGYFKRQQTRYAVFALFASTLQLLDFSRFLILLGISHPSTLRPRWHDVCIV